MTSESNKRLAMLLQAIKDEERSFSEIRTEHKDRLEKLQNAAYSLRNQILTGQMELVVEPPPEDPSKAA